MIPITGLFEFVKTSSKIPCGEIVDPKTLDKTSIRNIFDSISPYYDLLNQVLSFNAADSWRRKTAAFLHELLRPECRAILDVGIGTGDFLKWFLQDPRWSCAAGVDFSSEMMARARGKLPSRVHFVSADFHELPFRQESFDLVISGFTLRSVRDLPSFFQGLHQILRPHGIVALLDLTRPANFWHRIFFYPYLNFFLPRIGGLLSRNSKAYRFLADSVQTFQSPARTIELMKIAGFQGCSSKSFSFGAVTLIIGRKNTGVFQKTSGVAT